MTNYYINKETKEERDEYDLEKDFENYMYEIYEDVDICGYKMSPVRILKEMDEVAWNEGFNNWLDGSDWQELDEYNKEHEDEDFDDEVDKDE